MSNDLFATNRQDPPHSGPERTILEGFVDFHRDTLLRKCVGLSDEQLKMPSCEPSTLTLLGLVRHLAEVEAWFHDDLTDGQLPGIYWSEADPDGDFDNVADAVVADDLATYRGTVERSRAFAAEITDLDTVLTRSRSGEDISLRWIYVHLIEEYARHNGHADLLRERIDGATGE